MTSTTTSTQLGDVLCDTKIPMGKRFRTIFTLKDLKSKEAIDALARGFGDESALLKHEIAYVLGQMQNEYAIPYLEKVLSDISEDSMVRHEAGEALGAIGGEKSQQILEAFKNDQSIEVAETCQLALELIAWRKKKADNESRFAALRDASNYESVDPAPPITKQKSVAQLRAVLLDTKKPLFKRYRAMFALRNESSKEAVDALAAGLDDRSALFRHEIAYVLGQIQSPHAVKALEKTLTKSDEHAMVRHEAAEAIGAIASDTSVETLKTFAKDSVPAVSESCVVALDMLEYYQDDSQFQYADGLEQIEQNSNSQQTTLT
mmetsp:Transcript_8445/g.12854  ORF Transcript_8445/g.12854 Transcript_8445/m.12854 type:complete len:319 (-) Transcript_8445:149-1105(-)|eukprot:CAMPEP_0201553888 /NCGR_PEP_ID=MMETSP0173_2-20130828/35112_1 /ASSEMBLY_ACC=CAM_ASM_000268 /TAXON_ID=218659 /ORGANISM="Vexillifera sp., Strain DIVA3 564/2" /LENGTH=318 /DNA_ID=CAMNT_0047964923 /DNA_START=20 /DNA_END=976 /DNA_ORIENTATION=+